VSDDRHKEQDKEQEEQELGDGRRACRDPAESEDSSDDRDDEECNCPGKHVFFSFPANACREFFFPGLAITPSEAIAARTRKKLCGRQLKGR
jgi:hypothetical protein